MQFVLGDDLDEVRAPRQGLACGAPAVPLHEVETGAVLLRAEDPHRSTSRRAHRNAAGSLLTERVGEACADATTAGLGRHIADLQASLGTRLRLNQQAPFGGAGGVGAEGVAGCRAHRLALACLRIGDVEPILPRHLPKRGPLDSDHLILAVRAHDCLPGGPLPDRGPNVGGKPQRLLVRPCLRRRRQAQRQVAAVAAGHDRRLRQLEGARGGADDIAVIPQVAAACRQLDTPLAGSRFGRNGRRHGSPSTRLRHSRQAVPAVRRVDQRPRPLTGCQSGNHPPA